MLLRLGARGLDDRVGGLRVRLRLEQRGQHHRRHDGRVALDDEHRRVFGELGPGDLLVGHGAGVAAVAGGAVANLAEVAP